MLIYLLAMNVYVRNWTTTLKSSSDWQDFYIFSSTQKNAWECAIVKCQNKWLTWAALKGSKESSSTSVLDSCQVHINVSGIQHVPNAFSPPTCSKYLQSCINRWALPYTSSVSHTSMNNSRFFMCHILEASALDSPMSVCWI